MRQYHAENGTRPGEVYAECAGDHVTNYWPDTAAAWGQAVSLCHSGSDHANRLEDELRRRGFDGVTVGGNTQLQSANNGA